MTNFEKYADRDFITVENGNIIWNGYFYDCDGALALLEYSHFEVSIDDFINKYERNCIRLYEEYGVQCPQYITIEGEDGNTEASMEALLDSWINDATPLDKIDKDTPDGFYILKEV